MALPRHDLQTGVRETVGKPAALARGDDSILISLPEVDFLRDLAKSETPRSAENAIVLNSSPRPRAERFVKEVEHFGGVDRRNQRPVRRTDNLAE